MKSKLNLLLGVSVALTLFSPSLFATEILDTNDEITLLNKKKPIAPLIAISSQSEENVDLSVDLSSYASSNMESIPYEVHNLIFSFLSASEAERAANVCRYWRTSLTNEHHYSPMRMDSLERFNALFHSDTINSEESKEARARVSHLVIDDSQNLMGSIDFRKIIELMPNLRALKLHKARISLPTVKAAEDAVEDSQKQEIAPVATGLEIIKFSDCEIKKHQDQATINDALEEVGRYVSSILLTSKHLTEFKIQRMPGFFTLQILPHLKRAVDAPTFQAQFGSLRRPLNRLVLDCAIKDIPAEFALFPHISELRLAHMSPSGTIEDAHPVLGPIQFIPKLETLELSGVYAAAMHSKTPQPEQQANMERLLSYFEEAKGLKTLNLSATGIQHLSSADHEGGMLAPFKSLETLILSDNPHLKSLPSTVYQSPTLKLVDIQGTGITELKESVQNPQMIVKMRESEDAASNPAPSLFERAGAFASTCMHKVQEFIIKKNHVYNVEDIWRTKEFGNAGPTPTPSFFKRLSALASSCRDMANNIVYNVQELMTGKNYFYSDDDSGDMYDPEKIKRFRR